MSQSSAESEYRSMDQSTCEILWTHHLVVEVGLKSVSPTKLWCDNQAIFYIASNLMYHERIKHIEVDSHIICKKTHKNLISTGYVKAKKQLRDIFIKVLNEAWTEYFHNKLGVINIYTPA